MQTEHEHLDTTPGPEIGRRRLDARVVWSWRIRLLTGTVGLWIASMVLEGRLGRWVPEGVIPLAVAALGLALTLVWPPAQYRVWRYGLRAGDLYIRRGVVSRTTSLIPYRRIQHVDTRRDPIERWLGLARVVVFTAGIRGAEMTIPGIALEEAEALRDRLAELGGTGEGV